MAENIFNETGVYVNPPSIPSFGNAGQVYNADIFGGFNITNEKVNPLFTFRRGEGSVPNSEALTNLREASKIGSTMEFVATHVGVRFVKFGASAALSTAEAQALKSLLGSSLIDLSYGSNETKIGEFSGLHFLSPVDAVVQAAEGTTTAAPIAMNAGATPTGWIKLTTPIQIQKNLNISGSVRFGSNVPAVLYDPNSTGKPQNIFGFVVMLYGTKIVDA